MYWFGACCCVGVDFCRVVYVVLTLLCFAAVIVVLITRFNTHIVNIMPPTIVVCSRCNVNIDDPKDFCVSCNGYCGNHFHHSCVPMSKEVAKGLARVKGMRWFCDECEFVPTIHGIFDKLNDIHEHVKKCSQQPSPSTADVDSQQINDAPSQITISPTSPPSNDQIVNVVGNAEGAEDVNGDQNTDANTQTIITVSDDTVRSPNNVTVNVNSSSSAISASQASLTTITTTTTTASSSTTNGQIVSSAGDSRQLAAGLSSSHLMASNDAPRAANDQQRRNNNGISGGKNHNKKSSVRTNNLRDALTTNPPIIGSNMNCLPLRAAKNMSVLFITRLDVSTDAKTIEHFLVNSCGATTGDFTIKRLT